MKLPVQTAAVKRWANSFPAPRGAVGEAGLTRHAVAPSAGCNPPTYYYCYCAPPVDTYVCCPDDVGCESNLGTCICQGT
jgi:hypothetical protein